MNEKYLLTGVLMALMSTFVIPKGIQKGGTSGRLTILASSALLFGYAFLRTSQQFSFGEALLRSAGMVLTALLGGILFFVLVLKRK
jgi:ATP/ADP translocase